MAALTGKIRTHGRSDVPGCGTWSPWTTTATVNYESDGRSRRVSTSRNTPCWKKLSNEGNILPVNPYAVTVETFQQSGLTGTAQLKGVYCPVISEISFENLPDRTYNTIPSGWIASIPPVTSGMIADAVNSAIASSSSGIVQAPVSAVEARETYRLILSAMRRLLNLADGLRWLAYTNSIPFQTLWLEARYGWMPIIQEVQSAIEAYNTVRNVGTRTHGSGTYTVPVYQKVDTLNFDDGVRVKSYSRSLSVTTSIRGFALSGVTMPNVARYGTNIVTSAWELIRFSFIIDWFLDIGSFLAANSVALSGYKLLSSGYNVKTELTYTVGTSYNYYGSDWSGSVSGCEYKYTKVDFARQPGGGGGLPAFTFNLQPPQIADLLALLAQFYASGPVNRR